MKYTNFPNGFPYGSTMQNIPVVAGISGKSNVFWVDSNAPGNGDGTFIKPFQRISYALNYCKQNNGDVIYCAQNHHEDIQEIFELSISGLSIIGLGVGDARATFSVSGSETDACYFITGNNMLFKNLIVNADCPNLVSPVQIQGQNCVLQNCKIGQLGHAPLNGIVIGGAEGEESFGTKIIECVIHIYEDDSEIIPSSGILIGYDAQNIVIQGNIIYGEYLTASLSIQNSLEASVAIMSNTFSNSLSQDAGANYAFFGGDVAIGWVDDNRWYTNGGTMIGGGTALQFGINYGVASANNGAAQVPAHT